MAVALFSPSLPRGSLPVVSLSDNSQWNVAEPDLYGCTLWQGALDKDGYAVAWRGKGRPTRVHRAVWEERHGPIPDDVEIDHRCRRRNCLTDAHHTLVSRVENEKLKRWRNRVKGDVCGLLGPGGKRAHGMEHAMITPEGGRVCRICSRPK